MQTYQQTCPCGHDTDPVAIDLWCIHGTWMYTEPTGIHGVCNCLCIDSAAVCAMVLICPPPQGCTSTPAACQQRSVLPASWCWLTQMFLLLRSLVNRFFYFLSVFIIASLHRALFWKLTGFSLLFLCLTSCPLDLLCTNWCGIHQNVKQRATSGMPRSAGGITSIV